MRPSIELFRRALRWSESRALSSSEGDWSYGDLLAESQAAATGLLDGRTSLEGARVAFLTPPGLDYSRTQWGIWRAAGVAVPLCPLHPVPELRYVVENSGAEILVAHPDYEDRLRPIALSESLRFLSTRELDLPTGELAAGMAADLPALSDEAPAMILYTSGTTSRPKGVLSTHRHIQAQVETLVGAWGWGPRDHALLVLPLHHLHGIINVLGCALWAGAACRVHESFDARRVWRAFCQHDLSVFMGVPTIYARLIAAFNEATSDEKREWSEACRGFRLMVSGSSALPVTVLDRWREISGHTLLERYGMTETGMILSNPLEGERGPGTVGMPLPGVEVRMVDEEGNTLEEGEGELLVRGAGVFEEYWRNPEATRKAMKGGWFRTGDVARFDGRSYRLLGRTSVDIIKTGGYKVSALEIEEVLRTHPEIEDCAVVGIPDDDWGERVSAALVTIGGEDLASDEVRDWAKQRLASYKVPREFRCVQSLPRNALGKVTKEKLKAVFRNPRKVSSDSAAASV